MARILAAGSPVPVPPLVPHPIPTSIPTTGTNSGPIYGPTGEILFVPSGWWHMAMNIEPTIAVTQNYVSSANVQKARHPCRATAPRHLDTAPRRRAMPSGARGRGGPRKYVIFSAAILSAAIFRDARFSHARFSSALQCSALQHSAAIAAMVPFWLGAQVLDHLATGSGDLVSGCADEERSTLHARFHAALAKARRGRSPARHPPSARPSIHSPVCPSVRPSARPCIPSVHPSVCICFGTCQVRIHAVRMYGVTLCMAHWCTGIYE